MIACSFHKSEEWTYVRQKKEQAVERALTEGYEKYYRLAYSYVHNEADALDIVQEAAYKAILKSDSLKEPQYVETWVYRIVVNEACSFLRNRKESADVEEIQAASEDIYENIDLKRAIENLDPKDRAIVVLRFLRTGSWRRSRRYWMRT